MNDFFIQQVCCNYDIYLDNLQAITHIERLIGIEGLSIHQPGATKQNAIGYIAGFYCFGMERFIYDEHFIYVTPEMPSENEARMLALIMFVNYKELILKTINK